MKLFIENFLCFLNLFLEYVTGYICSIATRLLDGKRDWTHDKVYHARIVLNVYLLIACVVNCVYIPIA